MNKIITSNTIGRIILIGSIFIFGLKKMPVEMGIAVTGSLVFLAFSNLDKFSKFKGAGFEAELKDTVKEANATIENLKTITIPLMITTIDILAKNGRWTSSKNIFKNNHDLYNDLSEIQKSFKIKNNKLESAKNSYVFIHAWDMINKLTGEIEKNNKNSFSILVAKEIGRTTYDYPPSLSKFELLLKPINLNQQEIKYLEIIKIYYKKYIL